MAIDFDIFDDEPTKPVKPAPVEPKAIPKVSKSSAVDIDLDDLAPVRQDKPSAPAKEALFNPETQERIDAAKAKAKEQSKVVAAKSAELARQGGASLMVYARKAMAYRPQPGTAQKFKPSAKLIKVIAFIAVSSGLAWGVVHYWPESKPEPAAPINKESTEASAPAAPAKQPDVVAPVVVAQPEPDPADAVAEAAGQGAAKPSVEPQAPKQEPAAKDDVRAAPATKAKQQPQPTQPQQPQKKDKPKSDWTDKANDDLDSFFNDLNNQE